MVSLFFCLAQLSYAAQTESPTLNKIRETGTITLGVRDSSGALSFTQGYGQYDGYHVEICRHIASDIQVKLGLRKLTTKYIAVSSQNRISLVQNGTIDLECGSTTNTLARQRDVAFAHTAFIEEVRIAVKRGSGISSIADLRGKTVVSTTGSQPVQILRAQARRQNINFNGIYGKDHADSFLLLESGRADAFVMDASILAGNIANARDPRAFVIVGEPLSLEPIAIMLRRDDPTFKELVDHSLDQLMTQGALPALWDKWFLKPIPPSGRVMGLALSEATKAAWESPNDRPAEEYRRFHIETPSSTHQGLDLGIFCRGIVTGQSIPNCLSKDDFGGDTTYLHWLLSAWRWTLVVAGIGFLVALSIGLPVGALRTIVRNRWLAGALSAFVEVFRNIPILVQVFIWYFVVPSLLASFKSLPAYLVVSLALGLFTAARVSEQVRAGILAIPKGQFQAAKALGLTTLQSYRYVLLPVALRTIIPPLTSEAMNIIKNSAVAFAVSVPELTMFAMQAQEETARGIEIYAAVTLIYVLSALVVNRVMTYMEAKAKIPGTNHNHTEVPLVKAGPQ